MSAKVNIVMIIETLDGSALLRTLSTVWTIVLDELGPLETIAVIDYGKGVVASRPMESDKPQLPEFGPHESVFFYPSARGKGSLSVYRGATFSVVRLSVAHEPSIEVLLHRVWSLTRECNMPAILVGEELEVTDAEVAAILRGERSPTENDLCSLAIVTDQRFRSDVLARPEFHAEFTGSGSALFRKRR